MTTTQIAQVQQRLACIPDALERKAIELMPIQGREILLASLQGVKVNMMTDQQLDEVIASVLLAGLLKLGHKNHLEDPKDMKDFHASIKDLIREKWAYLTDTEIRLVFKMGVRGEFRKEPKAGEAPELVFLNEPNINSWFKAYKFQKKSEATLQKQKLMGSLEKTPALVMSEEAANEEKICRLEQELHRLSQPGEHYRAFDLGNVLQEWLEKIGVINLSDSEKHSILKVERQILLSEHKEDSKDRTKKLSYKLFAQAIEGGSFLSDSAYERAAKNNAKKATLRGFMLSTLEKGDDIRTLIMEQMEKNRLEGIRLRKFETMQQLTEEATHWHKMGDRHRLQLVKAEMAARQEDLNEREAHV